MLQALIGIVGAVLLVVGLIKSIFALVIIGVILLVAVGVWVVFVGDDVIP